MLQRSFLRAARTPTLFSVDSRLVSNSRLRSPALSAAATQSRCYHPSPSRRAESEASKAAEPKEQDKAGQGEDAKTPEPGQVDAVRKELEAKKKEALDVTDKWKRSIADYRNLQEQTKREVTAAREFAIQRFAKDLIDSVDNLDRALETVPQDKLNDENKDLKALHDGLRMTEKILMSTLKKHGLERFDPSEAGDKFDPNRHEATFQVPQPDKEDGACFHTQQKGFVLNGRILRAAKVGVVKNS